MSKKNKGITKILVLGLDNSGKTSIILNSFKKDLNLLSYLSLKPTTGIDITDMEDETRKMAIWDFGGQEKYRKEHLEKLPTHIANTNKVIFVLDIQDQKRYDKSLEYFKDIEEIIKENNIIPELNLYLHKFDPTLEKTHPEITKESVEKLSKKFREVAPQNIHFSIFKTSIFTFFKKTTFWNSEMS